MVRRSNGGGDKLPQAAAGSKAAEPTEIEAADSGADQPEAKAPEAPPRADAEPVGQPAPRERTYLGLGLALAGIVLAGVAGYFIGVRAGAAAPGAPAAAAPVPIASVTAPPKQIAASASAAKEEAKPAEKAPAKAAHHAASRPKPKYVKAKAEKPAAPMKVAEPAQESEEASLHSALAACGKFNFVCREKAHWHYCKGLWGKIPDCPQASTD